MYTHLNIKYLRKTNNFTQIEIAVKLNVTQNQVGKYERDESMPPLDKLKILKDLFKVTWDELIEEDLSKRDRYTGSVEDGEVIYNTRTIASMERQMAMYEHIIRTELPEVARSIGLIENEKK